MSESCWCELVETPAGWVVAGGMGPRLTGLTFPFRDRAAADWTAGADWEGAIRGGPAEVLDPLRTHLDELFNGRAPTTGPPIDLGILTPFTQRVLNATAEVAWGSVVSYGELARRVGSPGAARAVGQALGRNPVPLVVPCHRVVGAKDIGGFGGGLCWKRRLLRLEGIDFSD